ncbi:MAG TPA: FtsQ-type POTRA domain-containing protein [Candidatus Acidoferrales bacterium]|nr:FtsQ-type POTRA domain-containing protein [Candidatus Acidoferrales bacterium]
MKRIERTYLNFTFGVCVLAALYLTSQNWKNQLVLQDVKVYDASILTDDEVKTLADVHAGSRLYGLNLSKISSRVRQNPFVKEATVVRALPYDLTITVQERNPLALLALKSSMLSIDEDGIVLPVPLERKNNLPIITNITAQVAVGDTAKDDLMQAVNFLSEAERFGPAIAASIDEVQLNEGNLVVFTTASSLPAVVGKGNFDRKLLYLQKFLTEIAGRGDADYYYVDLRFDGQIVLGMQTKGGRPDAVGTSQTLGKVN